MSSPYSIPIPRSVKLKDDSSGQQSQLVLSIAMPAQYKQMSKQWIAINSTSQLVNKNIGIIHKGARNACHLLSYC